MIIRVDYQAKVQATRQYPFKVKMLTINNRNLRFDFNLKSLVTFCNYTIVLIFTYSLWVSAFAYFPSGHNFYMNKWLSADLEMLRYHNIGEEFPLLRSKILSLVLCLIRSLIRFRDDSIHKLQGLPNWKKKQPLWPLIILRSEQGFLPKKWA